MALKARQITLTAAAATPLLVQGSTGTKFQNIQGNVTDPLPLIIKNEDAAITVWIGGSDVDPTHGQSLPAGASIPMALYGTNIDVPYAYPASGTPIVSVLVGRQ